MMRSETAAGRSEVYGSTRVAFQVPALGATVCGDLDSGAAEPLHAGPETGLRFAFDPLFNPVSALIPVEHEPFFHRRLALRTGHRADDSRPGNGWGLAARAKRLGYTAEGREQ